MELQLQQTTLRVRWDGGTRTLTAWTRLMVTVCDAVRRSVSARAESDAPWRSLRCLAAAALCNSFRQRIHNNNSTHSDHHALHSESFDRERHHASRSHIRPAAAAATGSGPRLPPLSSAIRRARCGCYRNCIARQGPHAREPQDNGEARYCALGVAAEAGSVTQTNSDGQRDGRPDSSPNSMNICRTLVAHARMTHACTRVCNIDER